MSSLFRPMLACDAELDKLQFPLWASAKLDGIRAYVQDGVVISRNGKPIPNAYVQRCLGHLNHHDGELIVGEPTDKLVYNRTMSHVMSHDKRDFDLRFYAFDHLRHEQDRFLQRYSRIHMDFAHRHHYVSDLATLLKLEQDYLDEGYEGLILRSGDAYYKRGRSTVREGFLLKLKRFTDCDAKVIDMVERMHNANELQTDELGFAKRSSHQANMVGRGDMGALIVKLPDGTTFNVGTGFTDEDRTAIWGNPEGYIGKIAKVKFFAVGVKDLPRHPVFLGWRHPGDIS